MATSSAVQGPMIRTAWRPVIVVVTALALGVLTAYAQGWLPQQMGSLANSAGSWALAACALSLLASSDRQAALFGCVSLLGLLAGYVLGAQIMGYPSSRTTVLFWGGAAVLAGPVLGIASHWLKTRRDLLAAIGAGVVSGVLVGEGIYGLTRIADTTFPPYWWGEILVGLALLLVVVWKRLVGLRTIVASVALTTVVALAFVFAYSLGPSVFLS